MSTKRPFTDDERAELLSSPYVARITDHRVYFTRSFKQFVMDHIDRPGMTAAKVFRLAGFSENLFSIKVKRNTVAAIRREAASEEGLREAPVPKSPPKRKKHSETEFRELQKRVTILEQQISFLKKSQLLKKQDQSMRPDNTS